jgi:signal transduction histidine kinase
VPALLAASVASFVPLRYWDRVGPALVRRPAYLAAELVLATLILLLTGVESPFFYFTVGTALLGGLVYGWPGAALFGTMLVGVYVWVVSVRHGVDPVPATFQTYVGMPALYVLLAAAGAGARRLLDRQAEAEVELAEKQRLAAAEQERARLAREMHDSLAKTVHGIGFAALALSRRIERDPQAAVLEARRLAEDAKQAADEARDLIAGLRARAEGHERVGLAVRAAAERWAADSGIAVEVTAEQIDGLAPEAVQELSWIAREALRNVSRHGQGATRVRIHLRALGGRAVLTVADDGPGFEVPEALETLQAERHYGLVGMRERARLVGGDLEVESEPGEGTTVSAWAPIGVAGPAPGAPTAPPAAPERTVAGYTWQ